MGQEASAPSNNNGFQLQLPNLDIRYPNRPNCETEQEQPQPYDEIKNKLLNQPRDNISTKGCSDIEAQSKRKEKEMIYLRLPEE